MNSLSEKLINLPSCKVPKILHFVWLGRITKEQLSYINVWIKSNEDYQVILWEDRQSLAFTHYHRILSQISNGEVKNLINLQNEGFKYADNTKSKHSALKFLLKNKLIKKRQFSKLKKTCRNKINNKIKKLERRDVSDLFSGRDIDEYHRFYLYELCLRGNFACASDILRLLIIYRFGGIYIDIDTLPDLDGVFKKTNLMLGSENRRLSYQLLKSSFFLRKNAELKKEKHFGVKRNKKFRARLYYLLGKDFELFKKNRNIGIGELKVYENFFSLGATKLNDGSIYNNIICSHKKSKCISILLRQVRKNYKIIECKHINLHGEVNFNNIYDDRFENYRFEKISRSTPATFYLSGPLMVGGVLLAILYKILKIEGSQCPLDFTKELQRKEFGFFFKGQTINTPMGNTSWWR